MNPIYAYTNYQAVEDGWKLCIGPRFYITTAAASLIAPSDSEAGFDMEALKVAVYNGIARHYDATMYAFPPEIDPTHSATKDFAIYEVNGVRLYFIVDDDGNHIILPDEY